MDSFFLENKKEEHPFFSETPSNIHYKKPHKAWFTEAQRTLLKVKKEYKFNKPTNTFIREDQVRNSTNTVPARVWGRSKMRCEEMWLWNGNLIEGISSTT